MWITQQRVKDFFNARQNFSILVQKKSCWWDKDQIEIVSRVDGKGGNLKPDETPVCTLLPALNLAWTWPSSFTYLIFKIMIGTSVSWKDDIWKNPEPGLTQSGPSPGLVLLPSRPQDIKGETLKRWQWASPEWNWQGNHDGLEPALKKWAGSR